VRLGSLPGPTRDGTLVLISEDHRRGLRPTSEVPTLQALLDDWDQAADALETLSRRLDSGELEGEPLDESDLLSPLPRAVQWAEASTYLPHMERIRAARGMDLPPAHRLEPIVYQSGSDRFLTPTQDVSLADESWGLDLEATIAVVTGDVAQGSSADDAAGRIRLVMLTNDLTLRNLMPAEYAKGVGPYRAKPARAYAPIAVSTAALAQTWTGRLLRSTVRSWVNGDLLGEPDSARDCAFDFGDLLEYMTMTRSLAAGTIVGSGTVSNREERVGYSCLAEKRAVEQVRDGQPATPLLRIGDLIRIEAFDDRGRSIFGAIEQRVAAYRGPQLKGGLA
jgi:fumarylacetoacetate (FAA) hydrolase